MYEQGLRKTKFKTVIMNIFFFLCDIQDTQENKTYNYQVLWQYACAWGKIKNKELKEINTSIKINKKHFFFAIVL